MSWWQVILWIIGPTLFVLAVNLLIDYLQRLFAGRKG